MFRDDKGKPVEIFGKDIRLPDINVPHLSYGHLVCLGLFLQQLKLSYYIIL